MSETSTTDESPDLPSSFPSGRVVSVQVGKPRGLVAADGKKWRSAIAKETVEGPVRIEGENLVGDYQANRKYHGGPAKALCFFTRERAAALGEMLNLPLAAGAFGENLTLDGLTEDDICIGDTLAIGDEVLAQVSQPRQPCASLIKLWNAPTLPARMQETGWTGFYCRVLRHGTLQKGDRIAVIERPNPGWTIARANTIVYTKPVNGPATAALREVPFLSDEWTGMLDRRLNNV